MWIVYIWYYIHYNTYVCNDKHDVFGCQGFEWWYDRLRNHGRGPASWHSCVRDGRDWWSAQRCWDKWVYVCQCLATCTLRYWPHPRLPIGHTHVCILATPTFAYWPHPRLHIGYTHLFGLFLWVSYWTAPVVLAVSKATIENPHPFLTIISLRV